MDFFLPQQENFEGVPPEDTKIISLSVRPYDDAQRILVAMEMTPFEKRPHIEVTLRDSQLQEISTASFIEPMQWKLEFTMHIRKKPEDDELRLDARLYYPEGPAAEPVSVQFRLPTV